MSCKINVRLFNYLLKELDIYINGTRAFLLEQFCMSTVRPQIYFKLTLCQGHYH